MSENNENPPASDPPAEDQAPKEDAPAEDPPKEDAPEEEAPKDEAPKEEPPKDDSPPAEPVAAAAAPAAAGGALAVGGLGLDQEETSDRTQKRKPVRSQLCCCVCECSNENTRGKTCFCCLPIKAGIVLIGLICWGIAFQQFLTAYFKFMNVTLPWWYPFVDVLLFAPGFTGVCFFIGWFTLDCKRTRATLTAAIIQSNVSYILILIWHTCYLCLINKSDKLGHGFGEDVASYTWTSKKHTLYYELAWGVVAITFYIVALTAVRQYVNSYPEDDEKAEDAAAANNNDTEKNAAN